MKSKKHTSFEYIKLIFSIDKRLWFFLIFDVSTSLFYNLAPIGIVGYITNIYKNIKSVNQLLIYGMMNSKLYIRYQMNFLEEIYPIFIKKHLL